MGKSIIRIVFFACLVLPVQQIYAQSGIGIGTSNPNPNAALDIKSAANDKGILIPRLTSAQRLAMNIYLSVLEDGLLVFDSDLNAFYYWNGSVWSSINVVQDLQLAGNILSITNNVSATNIDLAPFSGTNTDEQTLSLTGTNLAITGGNAVDLGPLQDGVNDADSNPTNELQNLTNTAVGTNRTVEISGGTNTTFSVADLDNSSTNEIQDLVTTVSGTNRTIDITGAKGTTFSVADLDNSTANEIQSLSFSSPNLSISGGNSVTIPNTFQEAFKAFFGKTNSFLKGIFEIPFDNIEYDLNKSYNTATNDYVAPVDGIYRVAGMVSILPVDFQAINLLIQVNGVIRYQQDDFPSNTSDASYVSYLFDTEMQLAKGDVVEFFINTSGGFSLNGGNTLSYISGRLVVQL
jgi:hypothetical protein